MIKPIVGWGKIPPGYHIWCFPCEAEPCTRADFPTEAGILSHPASTVEAWRTSVPTNQDLPGSVITIYYGTCEKCGQPYIILVGD